MKVIFCIIEVNGRKRKGWRWVTLLVTLTNDTLIGEASGARQRELIPISPKKFVWFGPDSNVDMRITFISDTDRWKQYAVLIVEGNEVWRAEKLK